MPDPRCQLSKFPAANARFVNESAAAKDFGGKAQLITGENGMAQSSLSTWTGSRVSIRGNQKVKADTV